MIILALETATVAGSIAIIDDEKGLIGEVRVDVKIAHSERLVPAIQWLINSSQLSLRDIDAFAVSIGPGSFTGLRIGLSTAKGFSYSTEKPLIPVPTLDAFARTLPYCTHLICPMLDARKNQVYTALYKWKNNECIKFVPETAINPKKFLENIDETVVFLGEGVKIYADMINNELGEKAIFAPASHMSPAASSVAQIAREIIQQGIKTDPVSLTPCYIRKSEAEIKWKGS